MFYFFSDIYNFACNNGEPKEYLQILRDSGNGTENGTATHGQWFFGKLFVCLGKLATANGNVLIFIIYRVTKEKKRKLEKEGERERP